LEPDQQALRFSRQRTHVLAPQVTERRHEREGLETLAGNVHQPRAKSIRS